MRRRRMRRRYYAPRRVPHAFPPAYVRLKLIPLVPSLVATGLVGLLSQLEDLPPSIRSAAQQRSESMGEEISQSSQRLFFDEPGLDTLVVRSLGRAAAGIAHLGRAWFRTRLVTHADDRDRALEALSRIPARGYEALMVGMLAVGHAVGAMRASDVHVHLLRDSQANPPMQPPAPGHPKAHLRRTGVPGSLSAMCADIDEMYWSMTMGQTVKISRVGSRGTRRWIASIPGTSHLEFTSNANPADMESNIREVLGLPSAIRLGVIAALHEAMRLDGIDEDEWAREPVLLCGHSQAGLLAVSLASLPPEQAGVNVEAVLTVGAPARRFRTRPDVTVLAVAHDQDVIPAMDGSPDRTPDQRVTIGRRLVRPRTNPLYYAHSSATYTETVRQLERKVSVVPWGRVGRAVAALQDFLPQEHEDSRVFYFEIWQDVREGVPMDPWEAFMRATRENAVEPVSYPYDFSPTPLRPPGWWKEFSTVFPAFSQVFPPSFAQSLAGRIRSLRKGRQGAEDQGDASMRHTTIPRQKVEDQR
ncbi:alpha/beta hydrolase [Schaalia sp. ZJ1691]|uniref:alpha/beta hydrolase n=1 Tax=Schaalia sp. ZJ1691 TaxID=2709404 RepID=UPI0013EA8056|nr:alpha/beta hydrolase [Schaalia sp. ZJ1691]